MRHTHFERFLINIRLAISRDELNSSSQLWMSFRKRSFTFPWNYSSGHRHYVGDLRFALCRRSGWMVTMVLSARVIWGGVWTLSGTNNSRVLAQNNLAWSRHSNLALPTAIALQWAEGPIFFFFPTTSKSRVREMRTEAGINGCCKQLHDSSKHFNPCIQFYFFKKASQMDAHR